MNSLPLEQSGFAGPPTAGILPAFLLPILAVLCLIASSMACAAAKASTPIVLYINSYHRGFAWSDGAEQSFRDRLKESGKKIELSTEYLDSRRFVYGKQIPFIAKSMEIKYANYRPNVVVVSDNAAFDFAVANRAQLFPGVPIVFCGYNNFRPDAVKGVSDITGVNEEIDFAAAVEMALTVHPKTKTLVFILSTAEVTDRRIAEVVEQTVLPGFRDRYNVVVIKDASLAEIRQNLAKLPRESLLFPYGQISDQGAGRALTPEENGRLIAGISPVPVYGVWDFNIGTGVLGGRVLTGVDQGVAAADRVLRILNGESADAIPVLMTSPARNIFDYQVMQKFGLEPRDLPPASLIVNRPNSVWDNYFWPIIGVMLVITTETLLLVFLVRYVRLRRKALATLKKERDSLEQRVRLRTEDLVEAKNKAESANKAKSVFLSNMSHELRTPLNAVLGFSQLLQRESGLSEEGRKSLATINRSGQHLLALINDVLEISRIEAGRSVIVREPFDLADLLSSVDEMIRGRAEGKGLTFCVEHALDLPAFVEGDGPHLKQVLINLLGNAVKYTDQGQVTWRIDRCNGDISFAVSDTGPGISVEDQQRIFQAFYQTESGVAKGDGTGLGLAISLEYAQLMGGRLIVQSQLGQGSTFTLSLPLPEIDVPVVRCSSGHVIGLQAGQEGVRVLVVDDKADNRELVKQLLEAAGFDVRTADDGQQAVDAFKDWQPRLIWMDMRMPVMDGYESTRQIRALPGGDAVKIIALTASAFEEDRAAILAAGCDDMVRKPLEEDRLFGVMGELLGLRYRYSEQLSSKMASPAADIDLSLVPVELVAELKNAAELLDMQAVRSIVEQISQTHAELSNGLNYLLDGFRFDLIAALCAGRLGQEHDSEGALE